jgi:hypothetical protein
MQSCGYKVLTSDRDLRKSTVSLGQNLVRNPQVVAGVHHQKSRVFVVVLAAAASDCQTIEHIQYLVSTVSAAIFSRTIS